MDKRGSQAHTVGVIWTLAAIGCVLSATAMAALWAWHLRLRSAAVADAGWAVVVAGLAVFDAYAGDGAWTRRSTIAWMMGSWGARLAVFILWDRVFGHAENATRNSFWAFQQRAAAAVFFSLPALFASLNPEPSLSPLELTACGLWAVAFAGETSADRRLLRFRKNPSNAGRACRAGLWRYSRHPNYFFEWLMWMAYALFASASPWGWLAWACPIVMLHSLLTKAIPSVEAKAARSRPDEYRRYQETTSAFIPLPNRPGTAGAAEA